MVMTDKQAGSIAILGVFVADAAFRASRQPKMGETLIGSEFTLGPEGKGSNQAGAAARLGSDVKFISSLAGTRSPTLPWIPGAPRVSRQPSPKSMTV